MDQPFLGLGHHLHANLIWRSHRNLVNARPPVAWKSGFSQLYYYLSSNVVSAGVQHSSLVCVIVFLLCIACGRMWLVAYFNGQQ